jgi:hypothetical protein
MADQTARADFLNLAASWLMTTGHGSREAVDVILAKHRAEVLREGADLLDSLLGDNEHLARDWDWWDAATIPASCAALLRRMADTARP